MMYVILQYIRKYKKYILHDMICLVYRCDVHMNTIFYMDLISEDIRHQAFQ